MERNQPFLHERTFGVMNTSVSLYVVSDNRRAECILDTAEWFFLQVDWRLSRFRSTSELSALNRTGTIRATRMLFDVVRQSIQANIDTEGVFNPLIGSALIRAGYDRSFDDIGTGANVTSSASAPSHLPPSAESVHLDPISWEIGIPAGTQLDLGGIAKGWAVDRVFRILSRLGPCCVNAGGDVHVSGSYIPGGEGWQVDIADPFASGDDGSPARPLRAIMVKDLAIATSGIMKRRWFARGAEQHHLIDPRTGEPARNDLLSVTALAETTVQAEIATKTAFIMGEPAAWDWLEERRIPALLVHRNGDYHYNEWFPH